MAGKQATCAGCSAGWVNRSLAGDYNGGANSIVTVPRLRLDGHFCKRGTRPFPLRAYAASQSASCGDIKSSLSGEGFSIRLHGLQVSA